MTEAFRIELGAKYSELSEKLKEAADFVLANPVDIATRSLRAISVDAGLAPVTFTRMARAIGYKRYEDLREQMRASVGEKATSFSAGVERLQNEHGAGKSHFTAGHLAACAKNIQSLGVEVDMNELERVVDRLRNSRRVVLTGSLGSTGIAEYMSYVANFIADNWYLAGRSGSSLASSLIDLTDQDTLIVITKPPFANASMHAVETASSQGAFVVAITDTHKCPAIAHASACFIVPTASPHFFSSYVTTLALIETLIGMLAASAGQEARDRIAKVEASNRRLEYFKGS